MVSVFGLRFGFPPSIAIQNPCFSEHSLYGGCFSGSSGDCLSDGSDAGGEFVVGPMGKSAPGLALLGNQRRNDAQVFRWPFLAYAVNSFPSILLEVVR
jgi:hypothetical protein